MATWSHESSDSLQGRTAVVRVVKHPDAHYEVERLGGFEGKQIRLDEVGWFGRIQGLGNLARPFQCLRREVDRENALPIVVREGVRKPTCTATHFEDRLDRATPEEGVEVWVGGSRVASDPPEGLLGLAKELGVICWYEKLFQLHESISCLL